MKNTDENAFPEMEEKIRYCPICGELTDDDLDDNFNPGPTGHGPDICYSDADPGL